MPRRKTISFSKNTLAAMFKAMSEILEEDTEFAVKLRSELMRRIEVPKKTRVEIAGFFDKSTRQEDIKKQLDPKTLEELISIVNAYSLDQTKTIRKVKDKQKVIDFVMDRRKSLVNRYEGFR